MIYCLPEPEAQKIKDAIKNGKLSPAKLNNMTSAQRRAFFTELVGAEHAKAVNLEFEKKLLLKNQERAMVEWAKGVTGMSKKQKQATLDKIRDTYAEKKRRLTDPKENEQFLNEIVSDVYSKKFKTEISLEEAQKITELSQDVIQAKKKLNDDLTWKTKQDGLDFGSAKVALDNYTGGIKAEAQKELFENPFKVKGLTEKASILNKDAKIAQKFIAQNSRAIIASWDNSFWGRQGVKTIPTNPKEWSKNFVKSFSDVYQTLKGGSKAGDAIVDAVKADIYSRPNYQKGYYEMGRKLDIGTGEEEFPTSLPTKIPLLGRLFSASETAYSAGAMRLRADIADHVYKIAESTGIDMTDKEQVGAINDVVNSMTGRGHLGKLEPAAPALNELFFSVKFFKANLDTLLKPATAKTAFARKRAAINLLKIIAGIGSILLLAKALDEDSVELDPRSANFGKIRVGEKRFDVTGGLSSIVTLISRIVTQSTKSSTTNKVTKFGEGYGSQRGMDAIWQFTENKFSPVFSFIKEIVDQRTFEGDKPTISSAAKNLLVPIIVQTGWDEAKRERWADALMLMIADGLGISATSYPYKPENGGVNIPSINIPEIKIPEINIPSF